MISHNAGGSGIYKQLSCVIQAQTHRVSREFVVKVLARATITWRFG
jgi:hypothetical protein